MVARMPEHIRSERNPEAQDGRTKTASANQFAASPAHASAPRKPLGGYEARLRWIGDVYAEFLELDFHAAIELSLHRPTAGIGAFDLTDDRHRRPFDLVVAARTLCLI